MKKTIISLSIYAFISFFGVSLLSAETNPPKVVEGYNNLPWGSSIEDVKKEYENLEEITADDLAFGEKIFGQKNQSTTRYFRFYNGKLYWAKIIYEDTTSTTGKALVEKLVEIYGYFDDDGEYKEDNTSTFWMSLNYSPKLKIVLTVNNIVNDFEYITDSFLAVTYSNPIMNAEIETNEKNREKAGLEL